MEPCNEYLMRRARLEYIEAKKRKQHDVARSKLKSIEMLLRYGWKDVFKESLTPDGQHFRSLEEWSRFNLCSVN